MPSPHQDFERADFEDGFSKPLEMRAKNLKSSFGRSQTIKVKQIKQSTKGGMIEEFKEVGKSKEEEIDAYINFENVKNV